MKPNEVIKLQREYFNTGKTLPIPARVQALRNLRAAILAHEEELYEAMMQDLGKSRAETYLTEIGVVLDEVRHAIRELPRWAKPKRVPTPITNFASKSMILREPFGAALIMSPWNYPFQLCIEPLIGAIAAGNCAVIKVSKSAPHVAEVIRAMLGTTFDPEYICCTDPILDTYDEVLSEKYDIIFFTGSARVGRIVMAAAAKNLTPVVLELGGKSPCIVDETANIVLAAKRIAWGKFVNAGQTCVAPDHIIVQESVKEELLKYLVHWIGSLYGNDPLNNSDLGKIVSAAHYDRLISYTEEGTIVCGGAGDREKRKIAPTVISDITYESKIMQEEIFGPILPVISYQNIDEVILDLKQKNKPLSLCLFTTDKNTEKKVLQNVSYGGGCVNDTVMHAASGYLPFGGVGESGMGSYHGQKSFDTFSHAKSVLAKSNLIDVKLRYAPYSEKTLKLVKKVMK